VDVLICTSGWLTRAGYLALRVQRLVTRGAVQGRTNFATAQQARSDGSTTRKYSYYIDGAPRGARLLADTIPVPDTWSFKFRLGEISLGRVSIKGVLLGIVTDVGARGQESRLFECRPGRAFRRAPRRAEPERRVPDLVQRRRTAPGHSRHIVRRRDRQPPDDEVSAAGRRSRARAFVSLYP